MISKGGFFIKTNKILIALIVLLVGCMVVGAASAANTDDIAVSDLNANPDDSYMQVNAYGDYNIDITTPTNITEDDDATVSVSVTEDWGWHSAADGAVKFQLDDQNPTDYTDLNWWGTARHNFGNLTNGTHTVKVTYAQWVEGHWEGRGPWAHWVEGEWKDIANKTASFYVAPVVPVETNIVINNVRDLKVNEKNLFIYATEENGVEGSYVFLLNGASVISSENMVQIMGLPAGEYCLQAFFTPKDSRHYLFSSTEANFTVTKYNVDISVEVDPVVSVYELGGNTVTAVAKFIPGHYFPINQTVLFSLDVPQWFEAPIYYVDGVPYANFTFDKLGAGEYTVFVKYTEDDYFNDSNAQANFTINKAVPEINVTATPEESTYITLYGNTVTITATLPVDATGNAKIVVWREGDEGAHEYEVPIENGVATLVLDNLVASNYNYQVYYAGDVNYTENDNNGSFVINKADPELILEVFGEHPNVKKDGSNQDFGVYVKDNIFFFANLPADATGYVYFSLDGIVWYKAPVVDGKAQYEFGELPAGEYTLYAYYTGDDNYNPTESNTTFTVESPSPYVHDEPVVPTMANTGNPLLVLFIALAGLGIGSLRRKL